MDIRLRGTSEECDKFTDWLNKKLELRTVSDWYMDNRKCRSSILGRVYISVGEIKEKSEAPTKAPRGSMEMGICHFCGNKKKLAILMWDGVGSYAGVCEECGRTYLNEQYVGNFIKKTHPETYRALERVVNPKLLGVYSGPSGMQTIVDNGTDPLEGME